MTFPSPIDCLAGTPQAVFLPPGEMDMDHWNARVLSFSRMQGSLRAGSVPIYGDSITEAMDTSQINSIVVSMGIAGDTMRGWFNRVNQTPLTGNLADNIAHRAGAGILALGINDICWEKAHGSPQNSPFMFDLFKLWATGKWIIVAPLPINESMFFGCLNSDIDSVVSHIQSIYAGNPNFVVVNAKSALAPQGQLLPSYTYDGCHLSPAGYAQLFPLIVSAGQSLSLW